MKIRGSKADIAMACAGSLVETATPYSPNSEEGREGQAKHEALSYIPREIDPPLDEIAERHQVDVDDMAKAVAYGRQAWEDVARWLPAPKVEVRLDGEVTCGTADVISVGVPDSATPARPSALGLLDWKTGWSGDEHQYQLMGYADAARAQIGMPVSGYITGFEVWIRSREYRTRNFSAIELDGFRERAQRQIELIGKQYAAGAHCKFCPRQHQCQARDEYLRGTVAALVPANPEQQRAITREVLGQLYERRKLVGRAIDAYDKLLDDALADGPVPLGDGRMLGLKSAEQDKLDGAIVAELLVTEFDFSSQDLSAVLNASKSGIERVVKSRVAKGGCAAEMRRILGRLREAGGVSKVEVQRKEIITS